MPKRIEGGSSPLKERQYKEHHAITEKHKLRNIKQRLKNIQKANPEKTYVIKGRNIYAEKIT